MYKVALTACDTYEPLRLDRAVERQFRLLGFDRLLSPSTKVIIKPNLIINKSPDEAATTHPEVVAAVVRRIQRCGVREIVLAESAGGVYTEGYMRRVYEGTGMAKVVRDTDIRFQPDYSFGERCCASAKRCRQFEIITPALQADVIVNIAKLKTHAMMGFSGASKNLFGLVPGLKKPELHCRFPNRNEFAEMLTDLAENIAPQINFIDGIVGMEGNGPTGGRPRQVGVLAGSGNCFAADLAAMQIIGMALSDAPMLEEAVRRGHLRADLSDIELLDDPIGRFQIGDYRKAETHSVDFIDRLPKWMRGPVSSIADPRPVVNRRKCVGCAKCAQICPQKVIAMRERIARIDRKGCIKCYCCHEVCPERAIDIKRLRLFDL